LYTSFSALFDFLVYENQYGNKYMTTVSLYVSHELFCMLTSSCNRLLMKLWVYCKWF